MEGDRVSIHDLTYITIFANIASEHEGIEEELKKRPMEGDFNDLLESQKELFSKEMAKNSMEFWDENTSWLETLSIEERKQRMAQGEQAAQRLYGCRGVWYPLSSDIWGNATAESYNYVV